MTSNQLKKIKNFYLQLPKRHRLVISSFSIILLFILLIPTEQATASKQVTESALEIGKRYQLALPTANDNNQDNSPAAAAPKARQEKNALLDSLEQSLSWQTTKVRAGDSLAKILKRLGYSARTTYDISNASGPETEQLKKLNVGDSLRIGSNAQGELAALVYPLSPTDTLLVQLTEQGYQSSKQVKSVETRIAYAHGTITSNFWNAGLEAGLNDAQIISLANIFGWDIDFAQDIREDDYFNIVFENRYIDGEYIGAGDILAAEFINQNETFQAIRFSDGEYYTPEGKSMRKAFLRAPVNFKYISSNFKKRRFHPIQKRWKAHNGTDYRANTGTPVVAAGDGRVIKSAYNKFNGNYVFIQHGNGVLTKYLHFSKRAVKQGQRVKQGQVIGYVGATGLAEAPHLHYEFLLNGVHRNPRTVKLPDAQPIAKKYLPEFSKLAQQRLQQLSSTRNALVAMRSKDD